MGKFAVGYAVAIVLLVILVAYFVGAQPQLSMNVYTYGRRPTWKSATEVSDDYEFQKGEYGRITNLILTSDLALTPTELPNSEQVIAEWAEHMETEHNAELMYARVTENVTFYGGVVDHYQSRYTIHEAVFKGSPMTGGEILLLLLLVTFIIAFAAGFYTCYKLTGVSPVSLIVPTISTVLILAMVAVIGFIGLCFLNPKMANKILGIFKVAGGVNKI